MNWTSEADAQLRALWDATPRLSTAEIGQRMGLTKSAVIGRAHRMKLPARPSPIHAAPAGMAPLRPAPPHGGPKRQGAASLPPVLREKAEVRPVAAPIAEAPPAPPRRAVPPAPVRTCQFIQGQPRGAESAFCGAPAQARSPYCPEHHARCFTARVGPAPGTAGAGIGRTVGWPAA